MRVRFAAEISGSALPTVGCIRRLWQILLVIARKATGIKDFAGRSGKNSKKSTNGASLVYMRTILVYIRPDDLSGDIDVKQVNDTYRPAPVLRAAIEPKLARRFSSPELFAGACEVEIEHGGALYRLRVTALGKLILTK